MRRSSLQAVPSRVPTGILPPVSVDRASDVPLYRQVYDGYRDAIVLRRLRAGERVPSTRDLARELGISRIPVLTAFEQLLAEGYFEARVGAGTFVARVLPDDFHASARKPDAAPAPRGPRRLARSADPLLREPEPWLGGRGPFRLSQPAVEHFPVQPWSTLVSRHLRNPRASLLHYGDPKGHAPFREAVAAYLRTARGVRCEADQVLVVSGSQQALAIAARVLFEPGAPVWMEEPGYAGARDALTMAGARLVPVPVDRAGLEVSAGIAREPGARGAYVTPSHQYPLGVTMTAARRLQLLDWARRAGAWIVEDDYDSEYRYESLPIASLQGLDRDSRVVYVGTFSKVLFPALRLGYLAVPPDLVPRFTAVREAMDVCPPSLLQAVLADFIAEGHFGRHLRRMRLLYAQRRQALVDALARELPALEVMGDAAGMHLVAALPDRARDREVAVRAAAQGLWTMPLSACYLGPSGRPGLVLGYGAPTEREIR
ncbi:MAG TPA: PLP-dependent aminotransferase family protein, partial [Vicinamibacteria bacterium]|nr:PLP-dependent aminotransferase family protein [Vicinamibacteria bacterium]